jgi:uncharacterized protein YukE
MAEFQRYAEDMLTEIDSQVTNLHATWTGQGAAAHVEAHRHWARGEARIGARSKRPIKELSRPGA